MSAPPSRHDAAGRAYNDLRNKARAPHRPTQELLQLYLLEAFLRRLAGSGHRENLVLKGGVLLAALGDRVPGLPAVDQVSELARTWSSDRAYAAACCERPENRLVQVTSRGKVMNDYPAMIAAVNRVEPVPRRIRGHLAGAKIVDTTWARYVWEWSNDPPYYIPLADVRQGCFVDEQHVRQTRRGPAQVYGLQVADTRRAGVARLLTDSPVEGLTGTIRLDWAALDSWFEEDEQVFVHPRTRTCASTRCGRHGRSASSWTGSCWPSRARR